MKIGDVAADFGKGLFAGLAGTVAKTVSSNLEMELSGRGASETPAQAAEAVLGIEPKNEDSEARFSNLVHWGMGRAGVACRGYWLRLVSPAPWRPWRTSGWCGAPSKLSFRR